MTQAKFIYYLQGFHIKAISGNISKYDISDISDPYRGVSLQYFWIL